MGNVPSFSCGDIWYGPIELTWEGEVQVALITISYGLISAVCCFIAALFAFWAFAYKSKKMVICGNLERFIYLIESEPWLSLPENTIRVSFSVWNMFLLKLSGFIEVLGAFFYYLILILLPGAVFFSFKSVYGNSLANWATGIVVFFSLALGFSDHDISRIFSNVIRYLCLLVVCFSVIFTLVKYILSFEISETLPLFLVALPFIWLMLFTLFYHSYGGSDCDPKGERFFLISFVLSFSFFLTVSALYMGSLFEVNAFIPQTAQMLFSNVVFDGVTVVFTVACLKYMLSANWPLKVPIIVFIDVLFAALFACFSLYFGLFYTAHDMSFSNTINVLCAKSIDSNDYIFGPLFFVMHTTFIPTLLYMLLILFFWLVKGALVPVNIFFKKGIKSGDPLLFVSLIFGILGGFFAVAANL